MTRSLSGELLGERAHRRYGIHVVTLNPLHETTGDEGSASVWMRMMKLGAGTTLRRDERPHAPTKRASEAPGMRIASLFKSNEMIGRACVHTSHLPQS